MTIIRSLLIACALVVIAVGSAWPQDSLTTQKTPEFSGNDPRGLPRRDRLPRPFGANLFADTGGSEAEVMLLRPPPASAFGSVSGSLQGQTTADKSGTGAGQAGQQAARPRFQAGAGPMLRSTNDPDYSVQPGDALQVRIYGATTIDEPAIVDGSGDIFVPTVGPVHVGGTPLRDLQARVATAIRQQYVSDVNVYISLLSATPVTLFVTGSVLRPGQYAGSPLDSIVNFLRYAGGVDPVRGSYRDIQVLRAGKTIERADLYEFLLAGKLPTGKLRNGDTILVGPQGPTVIVEGEVRGPFRYELKNPLVGGQVTALARPYPDVTHVSLTGIRGGRPQSFYMTLREFERYRVADSDVVRFNPDTPADVISVSVEGRVTGPTTFVLRRQATLKDVLSYIAIDPYFTDPQSVFLRRLSVADAQKRSLEDTAQRLERSIVTSPTSTEGEANLRSKEAEVITRFSDRIRAVQPEGRVIVARGGQVGDIRLENGDVIVLPSRTDLVFVGGEVGIPQSVVWQPGATVANYVELSGGWSERADRARVVVQRASGETVVSPNPTIAMGDRIIVMPAADNHDIPIIKDITAIIYQIAVGVGVLIAL